MEALARKGHIFMTKKVRILSLGAGVQSTTVALMAIHGEIEPVEHAIFSDTGWETPSVYRHLEWLVPKLEAANIKFHKVKSDKNSGNIKQDILYGKRHASIPMFTKAEDGTIGTLRRQCTTEYKVMPVQKKEREIIGLKPGQRWKPENGEITNVMGISLDEIQRMKDNHLHFITNEYPLVDLRMTRHDCLLWVKNNGYPTPPRSACIGCPYHNNDEWRRLKNEDIDSFNDAVEFEKQMQNPIPGTQLATVNGTPYLHRSCVPLDQIDFRNEEDLGQISLFDQECEGMCGI